MKRETGAQASGRFALEPLQFDSAPFVLTVDVEDYFSVCGDAYYSDLRRWDGLPSRVEATTTFLLEMLGEFGVRGTFFVLGWVARRFPSLVRRIGEAGQEIASHGMTHEPVAALARQRRIAELRDSRSLLEDLSGLAVRGFRAAAWSIPHPDSPVLEEVAEAGYLYDASMIAVPPMGRRDNPKRPVRVRWQSGRTIVEFPPPVGTYLGFPVPYGGSWPLRMVSFRALEKVWTEQLESGAPCVWTLHPWEIDDSHPPMDGLDPLLRLVHFGLWGSLRRRLPRLLSGRRFVPLAALLPEEAR
jgi:polysaccharide deacetylase family protein (PEP-CTERM system associated)